MLDSLAMRIVKGCCYVFQHLQGLFGCKTGLLLENLSERSSLDKVSHEIGKARLHTEIVDRKYVWMIKPENRCPNLIETCIKTFARLCREQFWEKECCYHHNMVLRTLLTHVDGAQFPTTKQPPDFIIPQSFSYQLIYGCCLHLTLFLHIFTHYSQLNILLSYSEKRDI